jgi:cellulose synthase (UDP-forming)
VFWKRSEAPPVRSIDRVILAVLTGAGLAAALRLLDWWFRPGHVANPILFAVLSIAFWYGLMRIVVGWVNYLAIRRVEHRPPRPNRSVAIFTTSSPGEPATMFEKTLAACARITYPHVTYLLDDTHDPAFRAIAEMSGAVWLETVDIPGAKAGKINRALELTNEDFILVLDPDHIPFPEILDRVLGHFDDDTVGFVQVAQAYYNQSRSITAAGAAEQTYAFYGPGQMGLYGHGACVAIGANCTFRRSALESIGGHGVGLAEDLVTAIRLHAKGWRSVYVPEVVSRGLVPEDLGSYYRQQLKWSRGVYEVAFVELPRAFARLTWRQRLVYLTIGTYYLFGFTTLLFLTLPYIYLWTGIQPASMPFGEFLLTAGPVGVIGAVIYFYVQRWLSGGRRERGLHWRGLMLKVAAWPVFLSGTLRAIIRADIPYIPTEKRSVKGFFFKLAWAQITLIILYFVTLARVARVRIFVTEESRLVLSSEAVWGMVAFATLPVVMSIGALYAAWQSSKDPAQDDPWDSVSIPSTDLLK